ncbi:MAG: 4Fe-4S dicluster domain-containing protein [Candidatus Omnitrophota bacterium]
MTIDRERCKGCLLCISFCPGGMITVDNDLNQKGIKPVKFSPIGKQGNKVIKKQLVDYRECLGCIKCALICPDCCIEVYR